MYLAEDRILCLEIYSRIGKSYNLKYIPDAVGEVDPITSLSGMLGQRKRWINGSWFALDYVLENRDQVFQSNHSVFDILLFRLSMYYAWMTKWFTYYTIAIYFTVLYLMVNETFQKIGELTKINEMNYAN
jgi:chitin synthase